MEMNVWHDPNDNKPDHTGDIVIGILAACVILIVISIIYQLIT